MGEVNIVAMIIDILHDMGEEQDKLSLLGADADTRLYGETLDSISVVQLAAELEERLYDDYELGITIVDERAMSQKTSPFLSVKTLSGYVEKCVEEAQQT